MFRHRLPVLVVIATAVVSSAPSAHAQPKMYWTNYRADAVMRANLDGTEVEEVVANQAHPDGIAIDTGAGKVYWAIHNHGFMHGIKRANLDGTDVEGIVLADASDLKLAPLLNQVYWVEGNAMKRANLDGSNVEVLVVVAYWLSGIALDLTAGKVYWTEPFDRKIQRANLDGLNVEELVTSGLSNPNGIALDEAAGKMYWTDMGTSKILRANLDGSEVEDVIVTGLSCPDAIALDSLGGKMYWTDNCADEILRANLDGSDIETLLVSDGILWGIALIDRDCNQNYVFDDQDIANETSVDCDGNGIPDECQPGGLEDCNTNSTFDLCDIHAGTSGDCNGNAIPDDCDVDPSDPDGNGEVSSDDDGDGLPDECICFSSSPPEPERLDLPFNPESRKTRYLSFRAGELVQTPQAVRVTFVDLPAPYDTWNGVQLWVQEPEMYCENAGIVQADPCPGMCEMFPCWFWGASVGCEPWWDDWTQYSMVHVFDEGVVPAAVYDVQVVDETCDPADESYYSDPYRATTSIWGDVVGDCTTFPCSAPDGITGIVDVTAVLDKWKNLSGNVIKARVDIEGSPAGDHRVPDRSINITDVTYCLGAFLGDTYPGPGFPPPSDPPVCP